MKPPTGLKAGDVVRMKSGAGPLMTVLGPYEKPKNVPGVWNLEVENWQPGQWRIAWHVQGALRTAILPGEALHVVAPPKN